ncbi:hypothetical protein DdX_04834 [Ditylenchus destructor]|uniref:Uncharacterized protein n=1 Tax=Ditylenchus destructor TaxID=166010 RepID=A0AAD4R745_9BILA|nr:hypothetical protein DdX_04834 [Ditylenchus destructor]
MELWSVGPRKCHFWLVATIAGDSRCSTATIPQREKREPSKMGMDRAGAHAAGLSPQYGLSSPPSIFGLASLFAHTQATLGPVADRGQQHFVVMEWRKRGQQCG